MDADRGVAVGGDTTLAEEIENAATIGYDFVEVGMWNGTDRHALADRADAVRDWLEEGGLDCVVHLPFGGIDPGATHDHVREGARRELEACLDVAVDLGAETAVMHPESDVDDPEKRRNRMASGVRRLDEYAAERDIELCAETRGAGGYVTIADFGDVLSGTDASVCIDTGHARIAGYEADDIAEFLDAHAGRVSHFHLNDTTGPSDHHLPVGAGTIDFATIFAPLGRAGWSGTLTVESRTSDPDYLELALERLDALLASA